MIRTPPLSTLLLCAAVALPACTPDTEEALREETSRWLSLGETLYFTATRNCTAAVFETRSGRLTSAIRIATSWSEAQRALAGGTAVAFENITLSPSDFTGILMDEDPTLGSRIISAGLAMRDCMDEGQRAAYLAALQDPDSTMMYDPSSETVAILVPDRTRIYVGRGELG